MYYLLFIIPFITILNSRDKIKGFFQCFSIYSIYTLSTTVFFQYLHLFSRKWLIVSILLYSSCSVFYFIKKEKYLKLNIDYKIIVFFSIFLLYLFLPNFKNYPVIYLYPLYSDEWINYGLINFARLNNVLPVYNYLNYGKFFINLLLPFHSFISFFISFFNLNINTYVILGKIFNFLILVSVYILSRNKNISKIGSLVVVTGMLFVANSSFVTGLWHFIPLNLSFLFLVLSFMYSQHLNSFLSVLFYPPMGLIVLFRYFIIYRYLTYKYVILGFFISISLFFINSPLSVYIHKIFDLLIRPSVYDGYEKIFLTDMLPLISIPFIFIGLFKDFKNKNKNKEFLYITLMCVLFWVYYTFNSDIVVMDKVRFVTLSSWFLITYLGDGFDHVFNYVKKVSIFNTVNIDKYIYIILLIFLVFNIKNYSDINNYKKIGLVENGYLHPSNPVINSYFKQSDVDLFENVVKNQFFLSDPWTSLIIVTLTNGKALNTKSSYLTYSKLQYLSFLNSDCENKIKLAKKNKLIYFYGSPMNCKYFEYVAYNKESDKYLYRFIGNK